MNGNEFVNTLPLDERGKWRIEQRTITKEDERFLQLRSLFSFGGSGRYSPAGTYVGLLHGGQVVMSNTPDEIRDCREPVFQAKLRGGHVLINGLGLGWVAAEILSHENVEKVTIIEIDKDVILLVGPSLERAFGGRVEIIHADAFDYPDRLIPGTRFSVVWHDVWPTICSDNLEDMKRLHRRYGRRCEWQGSWCRGLCERLQ